jgi:two-component system sensor histidine kinase UhpB
VGDLAARLPPSAAASAHQADAIGAELMDLGVTLRAVAHRLHPSLVETVGLAAALEALAGELRRTAGLEVAFSRPPEEVPLKPDVGLAAYRIAQEALRNVLKHAGTARAELEMAVTPTSVVVRVKDQGAGLPPDGHREHGLGLRSMRERAELARGRLNVTSRPGQGTTVEAVLPREEASGTP